MEFIINLILTIIGVFLGWILAEPHRLPRWIALNKRSNWKGTWFLAWYPKLPREKTWVIDKVSLTNRLVN